MGWPSTLVFLSSMISSPFFWRGKGLPSAAPKEARGRGAIHDPIFLVYDHQSFLLEGQGGAIFFLCALLYF